VRSKLLCWVAVVAAASFLGAETAGRSQSAAVSPLVGVWRGDVVRVYNRAVIGRNVLRVAVGSARVGSTFRGELLLPPTCTAQFRIAKRTAPRTWVVGIPRIPSGGGAQCVLAGFSDAYTRDAFKFILLDSRRLRVTGLSRGVRVQATLIRRS
jgi:hypothetical protein